MNPLLIAAAVITAGLTSAWGRHGQGGAFSRVYAMLLYIPACAPVAVVYGPDLYVGTAIAVGLIALFYLNMTLGQIFSNLWLGAARNCLALVILAGFTGCPWVLIGMIPIFLVMKWAMSATTADPHKIWEFVDGGVAGACWAMAPFIGWGWQWVL